MIKKILLSIMLYIPFVLHSRELPDVDFGISAGDLGVYFYSNREVVTGSLGSFGFIEANTGLGINLLVWPLPVVDFDSDIEDSNSSANFLGSEIIGEPLYRQDSIIGWTIFYRIDHLIKPDFDSWRTGVRGQFQIPIHGIRPYPTIIAEAGYWHNNGFYWGLKFDPIVLSAVIVYSILEEIKEKGEENIPEGVHS